MAKIHNNNNNNRCVTHYGLVHFTLRSMLRQKKKKEIMETQIYLFHHAKIESSKKNF